MAALLGWGLAAVNGFVALGYAVRAERMATLAGVRATCWSFAEKRADKLAAKLHELTGASTEDRAVRLGAMPGATGCETGVSRAARPEMEPRPMCPKCVERVRQRIVEHQTGGWSVSGGRAGDERRECDHCGRPTTLRLSWTLDAHTALGAVSVTA